MVRDSSFVTRIRFTSQIETDQAILIKNSDRWGAAAFVDRSAPKLSQIMIPKSLHLLYDSAQNGISLSIWSAAARVIHYDT